MPEILKHRIYRCLFIAQVVTLLGAGPGTVVLSSSTPECVWRR